MRGALVQKLQDSHVGHVGRGRRIPGYSLHFLDSVIHEYGRLRSSTGGGGTKIFRLDDPGNTYVTQEWIVEVPAGVLCLKVVFVRSGGERAGNSLRNAQDRGAARVSHGGAVPHADKLLIRDFFIRVWLLQVRQPA